MFLEHAIKKDPKGDYGQTRDNVGDFLTTLSESILSVAQKKRVFELIDS